MSIVKKNGMDYGDGGYIEHTPIQSLIDKGCTHIDVIMHKSPELDMDESDNPLEFMTRIISIMMWEAADNDMKLAQLKAKNKDVVLNIYKPNRKLTNNSLIFDKELMESWWDEGYKFAENQGSESWCISKSKKAVLLS
jgi:NTE family protein